MEYILIEFVGTLEAVLTKIQRQAGAASGFSQLTIHQLQYLDAIHALGAPTSTQLADRLGITKASVTVGVNKLVKNGYVNKTQSAQDKRAFHLSLTQAAAEMVQARDSALHAYGDFVRGALSEEEARQLEAILGKLVRVFQARQQEAE